MTTAPTAFDVCGVLPGPGVTVLEASAGTGKTFTIAALVTRFVAEGVTLSEILAVTFTRLATGELRSRVRERLVSAHDHLERFVRDGVPVPGSDEVAVVLASGNAGAVATRLARIAEAISTFDEATITTTHGFCQLVLSSMGVSGDASPGTTLLENPSDLIEKVVDDLYLRRSLQFGEPSFPRSVARTVAKEALRSPDVSIQPPDDDSVPGRLARFAGAVRGEVDRRLRDDDQLTFDSLLLRLRDVLVNPLRGRAARQRLTERYQVVLIDEFQDTDPVQWEVVSSAFGTDETVLVLIGDPKQAIYAFRGADVFAYLAACEAAARRFTLGANYRSDRALLEALDALFDPLLLGHPDIPYRVVRPTPAHERPGMEGAPSSAALRVRILHDDETGVPRTAKRGLIQKAGAVEWVAGDVAADIVGLLGSGAALVEYDEQGNERARRPVGPTDIGVLVRTNHQAGVVHEALRSVRVPSVVASSLSVFGTDAALAWLRLLEALEQPATRSRVVAVALGPFVGMTASEVVEASDAELEELHLRLRRLGGVLRRHGVAALCRTVLAEGDVPARLLSFPDGGRLMTDLTQVAELLGAEAAAAQLGLPRLRALLARWIAESDEEEAEERTRRLDSDAAAVQILTIHRAKGLEFPVVYCPYLWDVGRETTDGSPVVFHDAADGQVRKLDVGMGGEKAFTAQYRKHAKAHHDEERGEQLRHVYVALTRAKHQAVLWWASVDKSQRSALGRLLMSRGPDGNVDPDGASRLAKSEDIARKLAELAQRAPGAFVVERATGPGTAVWSPAGHPSRSLAAAVFGRSIDESWRRSSYSAITAAAHDALVGSEPEERGKTDEPDADADADAHSAPTAPQVPGGLQVPCPLGAMPAGADVGTLLHRVLELTDFDATDLDDQLAAVLDAESRRHGTSVGRADAAVAGLAAAIRTPLGPLAAGGRLSDLARYDRLDELTFEFPVAGGDHAGRDGADVTVATIARLLRRHERPGAPLFGYADRLDDPAIARSLRGYMSGSIDLVMRRHVDDGERFFVIDYKSNRLAPSGDALLAWHYRPEALDLEMQRSHYPLQALLYTVALHRYLRWRLPGYDPQRHLGGVLYLFLRGMLGADGPVVDGLPCGVFAWRPDPTLVEELSALLDEGVDLGHREAT